MINRLTSFCNGRKRRKRQRNRFCCGPRTLCDLEPGSEAIIRKIGGNGAIKQRLLDLGITRDTLIRVERMAPLGDPIEINVKGYYLAIRMDEAKFIEVEEKPA